MSKILSCLRPSSRSILISFLLIAFATMNVAAATLVSTPSATQGWTPVNATAACGGVNTGTTGYVNGPLYPPAGMGSVRATTGSNGNTYWNYRNASFDGVSLSTITSLSYDTYVAANLDNQAFWIRFEVDIDNNGTVDTTLDFEPAYQTAVYNPGFPQGPVAKGVWQHWDGLQGKWYGPSGSGPGANTKTWTQALALIAAMPGYVDAKIKGNIAQGGFRANAGCGGSWANFDGNIDNLTLGVSGVDTTYDFEPVPSVVNVGQGSLTNTPNYTQWFFWNDENDTINNTLGSFVTGPAPAPLGTGSAQIGVSGSQRRNLATYQFAGTPLADINTLRYSTYNASATNGGHPNAAGYLQFNVDFNGSDTWQSRMLFLPADNGVITQNAWQEWDTIGNGTTLWRYSGGTWPGTGTPGTTPRTWSNILASYPGVRIRVTDSWLGVRVGEPYSLGYVENIDAIKFGTANTLTFFNFDPLPAVVYVDDSWTGSAPGSDPDGAGPATSFGYDAFAKIQDGINGVDGGGTVNVATGTYVEDINVNKAGVTVSGAGMDSSIIMGPHGVGDVNTILMGANNVTVQGFTITRTGNTTADWATNNQDQGVNFAQLTTGSTLQNCKLFGNRNGVYMNHTGPHTVRRNVIDNNRTGIQFANDVNGAIVEENFITNNHTLGMVMSFDQPGYETTGFTVRNNNISGNWYGQVVNRFVNTTVDLDFSGNWLGTATPTRTTANSAEPGYPNPHPVMFGGTATPPAPPAHAILGVSSAKIDYSPYLSNGGDTDPGTPGFQGDFSNVSVTPDGAQVGGGSRIQEANDLMTGGGTLNVPAGTYPGNVNITKAINVKGSFTVGGTFTLSNAGAQVSPGTSPGIINSGSLSLTSGSTVNIEINGPNVGSQYDQLNVTGTVSLGNATLNTTLGFAPTAGQVFTIINNDGGDAVTGTFAGLAEGDVFYEGAHSFRISYVGGTGNDVTLTSVMLCNAVSISTGITTLTGTTVNVPITVDDTTGNGLYSTDFTLTYNSSVINAPSVSLGTVTAGSVLTVNDTTPGVLIISIFNSVPFSGAGTLANVSFSVPGLPGTSSPVTFSAFKFNEGTQCLSTSNGLVTVVSGTITGTVTYGNPIGTPAPPRFIPDVTLSAAGSTPVSTTTGSTPSNGQYTLSGMGAGAYTVTPSKVGGVSNNIGGGATITSFDASLLARYVVGLSGGNAPTYGVPFVQSQIDSMDVSGTGGITSFDGALIARWVAGLSGTGNTAAWIFTPANRVYSDVNTDYTAQDYSAILMGDVSGNYDQNMPVPRPAEVGDKSAVIASVPTMTAQSGSTITVPVTIGDTTNKGVVSYQFELSFDPDMIEPAADPVDLAGTMSEGYVATVNALEPGLLRVVVFGALPFNGEGNLINLRFNVIGKSGVTDLGWNGLLLNEGNPRSGFVSGRIRVMPDVDDEDQPALGGRVLTANGQAVSGAVVTVTDTTGKVRSVVSNVDGVYRVRGVEPGQAYTITVEARQHAFTPITVSAGNRLTITDLIAN